MALYTLHGSSSSYRCSALLPVRIVRVEGGRELGREELPVDEMGSGF